MMIKNMMHEGKLVPSELIVKLLFKAMLQSGNDKFLVDGFPRNEENRQAYDSIVRLPYFFFLLF
jgi:UMP-CMP kinase